MRPCHPNAAPMSASLAYALPAGLAQKSRARVGAHIVRVSFRKFGWCCRTPQQLLKTVDLILQTYERSAGSASMLGQAGTLMNPEVITRMKDIQAAIQKDL